MKRVLLFVSVLVAVVAVSCKKETVEDKVTLSSAATATVPQEGDVVTIKFNSSVAWTAKSSEAWLTVSPASGEAGDATIKASAVKNETTDARVAKVTITAGTKTAEVTVTQGQLDALEVKTLEFVVSAEGGTVEVPVSANVDYQVVIPEAVDWITVTKGMVDSKVVLDVDETHEYTDEYLDTWTDESIVRSANITIKAGGLEKVVTIGQKTFTPYFDYTGDWAGLQWSFYDGAPVIFPQEGGEFVIDINTNIEWRAYMSVYSAEIDAGVDIMDNGWTKISFDEEHVYITMAANDSYFSREDYLYTVGIIDEVEDGNFGGLGWFRQAGKPVEGADYVFDWSKTLTELSIPAAYNRLAYAATGDLLISDGEKVYRLDPADGSYVGEITYSGITPSSICSDDAGNVLVAPNVDAPIDWNTGELLGGKEFTIYYSDDPSTMVNSMTVENKDYGTIGGIRVRGDISKKAVITGVAGSASCWFGYDINEYTVVGNDYGVQNQGPGPGGVFWTPESAASISLGTTLADGVLFRGYDGTESLYYLADAYTPNWLVPYDWKLLTNAGSGGNENQNNLALVDYKGKKVLAYTQGFHFNYSSNATIYVLDVTDINDVKPLVTINPLDDGVEFAAEFTGASGADVLLHPADECLELYAVNSGRAVVCKYKIVL